MATKENEIVAVDFDIIPDEILVNIFSKLPLRDLLLCVRQVCVRWYHLSKDETLWRDVDFHFFCLGSEHKDKEANSNGVHKLFSDIESSVEKVVFSNVSFNCNVYELFYCSSSKENRNNLNLTKLRSLDYSYSAVGITSLCRALSTQPQLQELILVHTNVLYSEVMGAVIHLLCLKKLVFHDLHAWENLLDHRHESRRMYNKRVTIQVSQHCTNLEWVELYTIWSDLDNDVFQNFTKNCPKLKRLFLTWSTHVTTVAFVNTLGCSNITHLGLADRQEREPYLNFVLPHFPQLISLTVNGRDVHFDDCVALSNFCPLLQELVFELKSVKDHDCLFEFYLHQHNSLSGADLQQIVEGCKQLRKLHTPCSKVDDDSILKLSLSCPLLEDVNFMHCPLLTVQSLVALSENCPRLRIVNFQHTFNPHDYLQEFLSRCPLLHDVNFDISSTDAISFSSPVMKSSRDAEKMRCGCKALTLAQADYAFGDGLPFIDMESSQESIGNCFTHHEEESTALELQMENACLDELEDVSYNPVLSSHSHIQRISVKNTNLSETMLHGIFRFCPDLTHVVLEGCINLSDETVTSLVRSCRHLKVLMMSAKQLNFSIVGDQSLVEISKYSRNLEVLSVLYNSNLTQMGIFSIFRSLDLTLRKLRSFSFCVGSLYGCKMPLKPPYGIKYLTERAQQCIGDGGTSDFRILHLDFKERRVL